MRLVFGCLCLLALSAGCESAAPEEKGPLDPAVPAELVLPFEVGSASGTDDLSAPQRAVFEAYRAWCDGRSDVLQRAPWWETTAVEHEQLFAPETRLARLETRDDSGRALLETLDVAARGGRLLLVDRRSAFGARAASGAANGIWACPPSAFSEARVARSESDSDEAYLERLDSLWRQRCVDLAPDLVQGALADTRLDRDAVGRELATLTLTLTRRTTVRPLITGPDLPRQIRWQDEPRAAGVSTTVGGNVIRVRGLMLVSQEDLVEVDLRGDGEDFELRWERVGWRQGPPTPRPGPPT